MEDLFKELSAVFNATAGGDNPPQPSSQFAAKYNSVFQEAMAGAQKAYADDPKMQQVAMSQAILESGLLGQPSTLATKYKNLFGIKEGGLVPGTAGSVNLGTNEVENGQTISINAAFSHNASYADSFNQHRALMEKAGRYKPVLGASTPEEAFQALQQAGYATDPAYANKLTQIYNKHVKPLFADSLVAREDDIKNGTLQTLAANAGDIGTVQKISDENKAKGMKSGLNGAYQYARESDKHMLERFKYDSGKVVSTQTPVFNELSAQEKKKLLNAEEALSPLYRTPSEDLKKGAAEFRDGPLSSVGDVLDKTYKYNYYTQTNAGLDSLVMEAAQNAIKANLKAVGKETKENSGLVAGLTFLYDHIRGKNGKLVDFVEKVKELQTAFPDVKLPYTSADQIYADAGKEAKKIEEEYDKLESGSFKDGWSGAATKLGHVLGGYLPGAIGGLLSDPVNVVAGAAVKGASTAAQLIPQMAKVFGLEAGIQAVVQPKRKELGLEAGVAQGALNAGLAAGGFGALEGAKLGVQSLLKNAGSSLAKAESGAAKEAAKEQLKAAESIAQAAKESGELSATDAGHLELKANAVAADAEALAVNPYGKDYTARQKHEAAIDAVTEDLAAGKAVRNLEDEIDSYRIKTVDELENSVVPVLKKDLIRSAVSSSEKILETADAASKSIDEKAMEAGNNFSTAIGKTVESAGRDISELSAAASTRVKRTADEAMNSFEKTFNDFVTTNSDKEFKTFEQAFTAFSKDLREKQINQFSDDFISFVENEGLKIAKKGKEVTKEAFQAEFKDFVQKTKMAEIKQLNKDLEQFARVKTERIQKDLVANISKVAEEQGAASKALFETEFDALSKKLEATAKSNIEGVVQEAAKEGAEQAAKSVGNVATKLKKDLQDFTKKTTDLEHEKFTKEFQDFVDTNRLKIVSQGKEIAKKEFVNDMSDFMDSVRAKQLREINKEVSNLLSAKKNEGIETFQKEFKDLAQQQQEKYMSSLSDKINEFITKKKVEFQRDLTASSKKQSMEFGEDIETQGKAARQNFFKDLDKKGSVVESNADEALAAKSQKALDDFDIATEELKKNNLATFQDLISEFLDKKGITFSKEITNATEDMLDDAEGILRFETPDQVKNFLDSPEGQNLVKEHALHVLQDPAGEGYYVARSADLEPSEYLSGRFTKAELTKQADVGGKQVTGFKDSADIEVAQKHPEHSVVKEMKNPEEFVPEAKPNKAILEKEAQINNFKSNLLRTEDEFHTGVAAQLERMESYDPNLMLDIGDGAEDLVPVKEAASSWRKAAKGIGEFLDCINTKGA